jgi:predicted DNA-binding protein
MKIATTIRLSDEDKIVLAQLQEATGLGAAAAIRVAIRESLAARGLTSKKARKVRS